MSHRSDAKSHGSGPRRDLGQYPILVADGDHPRAHLVAKDDLLAVFHLPHQVEQPVKALHGPDAIALAGKPARLHQTGDAIAPLVSPCGDVRQVPSGCSDTDYVGFGLQGEGPWAGISRAASRSSPLQVQWALVPVTITSIAFQSPSL